MTEMDEIRLEALKGLTILTIHDDQFRRAAMEDLEGTLRRYGYDLTDQEMERLRYAREEISGMSEEDLLRDMRAGEQRARYLSEEEERVISPEEFISYAWY
jgi:DNA-binding PadR family transcriptional regulator